MKLNPWFVFWFCLLNVLLYLQVGWWCLFISTWVTSMGKTIGIIYVFITKCIDAIKGVDLTHDPILTREWLSIPFLFGLFYLLYLVFLVNGVSTF